MNLSLSSSECKCRLLKNNLTNYMHNNCLPLVFYLRACSHEPGTVNYPGVTIAPGQALPRVHMMVCCPGASSSSSDHNEFIRIPLVFTQIEF